MRIYPTFFRLVFSGMDPERAHRIGFALIRAAARTPAAPVMRRLMRPAAGLRTEALGLSFPSPFGLAAGFDKEGSGIGALANLGFGHVEVGTVTAQAQPGNAKPRLFRLVEDRAVINRMGFNNDGAAAVAPRLDKARRALARTFSEPRPVIGINIGKTKKVDLADAVQDYLTSARTLAPHADYLAVNVSSPNTPGLRLLQDISSLRPLLTQVGNAADDAAGRHVPLLVKIAPDLTDEDIDDVAELALSLGLDGVIATNTTVTRENLATDPEQVISCGVGGLSGAPLKRRSLEVLRRLHARLEGSGCAIISVGGVETAADVRERLAAGATLVQGYTAFLYEGPFWAARINRALARG
ncbi:MULTISPECIES: quinone-dependent dihydroorotate dehydrogenase [unclassified Arthrobacter]|uniref:quinone-dependent dihydroorotate dehydrogenase n=1 Tax=unclassified Arthrobacter TaxID=235627 RepID=UPI001D146FFD|nr:MULTISPECIES: quinone-dependent dihydroorotate dehydrogenase [unclassified Arthrobacter]MCC3274819.1 quinone-dependent dihydroorotate dehydrogenase [Arthrobacter sp. zg-Y20]MCC9177587.1 quinone-dependent dihydroorotate dehydrogenase [Arthrobacter sp. zg-Y750]MDK1314975.1 quinone-dependent dihydroorotate dehydrogenase [Arthrobacter sp. zg.Y20]WIB04828.1 quinone-dependent dihydroorotate dehydrogenase [Arthrobacter sp. zg-Y20]